jgi:hypothetical protein
MEKKTPKELNIAKIGKNKKCKEKSTSGIAYVWT